MKSDVQRLALVLSCAFSCGIAALAPPNLRAFAVPASAVTASQISLQDPGPPGGQGTGDDRKLPLLGKITAVHDASLDVLDTNGATVIVKLTGQTQYRKDRQPAKRNDFKPGDIILVRGDENPDHSWTAQVVAARSLNGANGPGGFGGPGGAGGREGGRGFGQAGTLGKDFVTGEIKSIDAPKLSVLRSDNVTQTLELNEETSLRKGRDSITMADIQPGDHLFARGALENNVFVPKMVMVIGPEQWKRMQEMGDQARGAGSGGSGGGGGGRRRQAGDPAAGANSPVAPAPPADNPNAPPPAAKPPEPQR
jgi:hypothetical protein